MSSRIFVAVALAGACTQVFASTTVFTSSDSFLSNINSGYHLNTFTGPATPATANVYSFVTGGSIYQISSPGATTWTNGSVISNNSSGVSLQILLGIADNVTAIGGNFFRSPPAGGAFVASTMTMTVNVSDGSTSVTSVTYAQSALEDTFRGFTSSAPIYLVTLAADFGLLNTIDNLIVGTASPVPEPSTSATVVLGMITLLTARRRSRLENLRKQ